MRKLILMALLATGAGTVSAQKLELIPKAGINISKQAIDATNAEKFKVGFQGGLGLNIHTGAGGFSVQPEINFIGKGTKLEFAGRKTNLELNYLELPVLAKYAFGPVYINAGPSIALMIDKESKFISNYGSAPKKFEFGVQMGAGVALPVGPGKIIIDGRYALGLTDVAKSAGIKNRGIMASLGYAIPLGGKK
ncbi:porin family protein [Pedobacter aquatilis]|uniref:porin family protein n=1 Tax=Pedobacter aquatilis TaxID=351343 RepID=UPI0029311B04|nr:porin family protein [Pedobacter aquatilis]